MLAIKTIVNKPVLMQSNPAVNSRNNILVAVLAKPFLKLRRQSNLVLHCNSSCYLYILVGKLAVFLKNFFGLLEQQINTSFCNLLLFD